MNLPEPESYAPRFLGGIVSANWALGVTVPGRGLYHAAHHRATLTGAPASDACGSSRLIGHSKTACNDLYTTVAHETTHLDQGDLGRQHGWPNMVVRRSGRILLKRHAGLLPKTRLHHLSTVQDMPTLQAEVGYQTNEADGCTGWRMTRAFVRELAPDHLRRH